MRQRWMISIAMLAGALAAGRCLAQSAPAGTQPASAIASSSSAPATAPSRAASAPAPIVSEVIPAAAAPGTAGVRFQFENENYRDVVRFIARVANKPIMGDLNALNGSLTYFDAQPYTVEQAMGLVNQVLRGSGFTLIDAGRYLKLVPLAEVAQQASLPVIQSGQDSTTGRPDDEIVTAIMPTRGPATPLLPVLTRMVHSFGTLAVLDGGNGLVITDSMDNIRRIQRLISRLDSGDLQNQTLKHYKLKTAAADGVARLIDQLFNPRRVAAQGGQGRQGNQPAPAAPLSPDAVTVAADLRSNTVIVLASPDKHEMIAQFLSQIDVDQAVGEGSVRVIALKKQKAADLAKTILASLASKPVQTGTTPDGKPIMQPAPIARVVADEATNRLIVSGTPDVIKQAEAMVAELDAAAMESSGLRVFPLKVATAANLVPVVQNTFAAKGAVKSSFVVTADGRTNSLIVNGSAAELDAVAGLILQLDQQTQTQREIHVTRLPGGDATQLAAALTKMLSQKIAGGDESVKVEADRSTNSLIISASPGDWTSIESILTQLTKEAPAATVSSRIFKLASAKANDVAPTIQRIFDTRQRQGRAGGQAPQPVVVAAEVQTNSLIVSASGEDMTEIESLVKGVDVPSEGGDTVVQIVSLTKAEAASLADAVNKALSEQAAQNPRGTAAPTATVVPEPNSNSLMVRGPREQVTKAIELIRQLDQGGNGFGSQVKVFKLNYAEATLTARTLDGLFRQMIGQARRSANTPPPAFSVAADERTNSLIVSTSTANLQICEALLAKLDAEGAASGHEVQFIPLTHADATELVTKINTMFADRPRGDRPTVEADSFSNGLTIIAKDTDFRAIQAVVEKWDESAAANYIQVKVVPMAPTARAEKMAEVLKRVYEQVANVHVQVTDRLPPRGSADGANAKEAEDVPLDMDDSQPAAVAVGPLKPATQPARPDVFLAVDRPANALIISAARTDLDAIQTLIDQLISTAASVDSDYKVFKTRNDPAPIARTLNDLFNPRQQAQAIQPQPMVAGGRGRGAAGANAAAAMVQPAATVRANASIVSDSRTRSIIVRAKPTDLEAIEQLVKDLDTSAQVLSELRIFNLKNADATEVADNLRQLFNLPTSSAGRGVSSADPRSQQFIQQLLAMRGNPVVPGQEAPMLQADASAGVTISSNRLTNAVIVAAPSDAMELAARLVQELDQSPASGAQSVKMFRLKQAEVNEVVDALRGVFSSGQGGAAAGAGTGRAARAAAAAAQASTAVIAGNETSRMVIVSARQDEMPLIEQVIKELDQAVSADAVSVKVYHLEHGDATSVGNALRTSLVAGALPGGQGRGGRGGSAGSSDSLRISAEPSSSSLVVRATPQEHEKIAALITQLDQVEKASSVFLLPLKNANAAATADIINRLYQQQAQASQRGGKTPDTAAISADPRSNTLIVAGSEDQFKAVSKLVNQIDEMAPGRDQLRLIQLKNAKPDDVLKAIQILHGGSPDAVPSGSSGRRTGGGNSRGNASPAPTATGVEATVLPEQRALLINASEADWKTIQELVKTLDDAAEGSKLQVQLFSLSKASNIRVAAALATMYRAAQRTGHAEDNVTVTALDGTNAVVVTATQEKMPEVTSLIKQLDVESVAGQQQFKLFPLKNASAQKVLPVLSQMLQPIRAARPTQPINISAEPASNSIVVATQAPVLEEIAKMLEMLDSVPPFKSAEMMILPLKNADAPALAATLTDILTPGTNQSQTPEAKALQEQIRLLSLAKGKEGLPQLDLSKPIKISSDPVRSGGPGSNSLIVSSTPENLTALTEIVSLLDTVPVAAGVKLQLIHLQNADSASVMTLLNDVFKQGRQLAGRPGTPQAGKAVPDSVTGQALTNVLNVSVDARTNTLVLAGSEETIALAMLIIRDLDGQTTSQFTEVKLFKLDNADAATLAPLVRAVFAEAGSSGGAATGGATGGGAGASGAAGGSGMPARPGAAASQPSAPSANVSSVAGARDFVTRLRLLRDKQTPVEAEVSRSYPTISVQADRGSNVLVVAARSDLLPLVAELVKTMDVPGAGSLNSVRICPLKNADATRVQQVINGLFTGPNANLIRPEDRPTISVDSRTNSLIVSASDKTFALLEALLAKLDATIPIDLRDMRLVALKNADATTVATSLQKMMDARVQRQQSLGVKDAESLRMIVMADQRSNMLIIGGSDEGFKLCEDMAKQLDSAEPALSGMVQLVGPLTNANAGTLAATLTTLFNQRYAAARTPDMQKQKPVILPDLRTNMLLVSATQDDEKAIESLVAKMDSKPLSPAVELEIVALKFNDAGAIGPVIQRIFADRLKSMTPPNQQPQPQDNVSVEIDPLSNAMIISASKENLAMIKELIAKVDVEPPTDTGVVKMYPLKKADVQRVSTMLQSLISQGLYKPGMTAQGAAGANAAMKARERVAITADVRTNVLIVSASKENFAVINQIVAQVDGAEGWGLSGNVQIFTLKFADATRLGPTLQQLFDRKRQAEAATGGGPATSLPIVVIPDDRTNTLLIASSKEDNATVVALLAKLDVQDVARSFDFRVFYLKNNNASTLEPILKTLFAQRPAPAGRPLTPMTVVANPTMNALVVSGDKDDLTAADVLIAKLDESPAEGTVVKAFPVVHGDAVSLAKILQSIYDAQRPAGARSSVTFTADERTNTIIVSAPKTELAGITAQIDKLTGTAVTDVSEIRIFNLKHADATQLATTLGDALTNKPKPMTTATPNRSTLLQFIQDSPDGQRLMASALKEGVMVTPVQRTNSLLVQAPAEAMPMLVRLIEALDLVDPRAAEIRVFSLVNADATQMATVLTQLFKLQVANTARQAARYSMNDDSAGANPTSQPAGAVFGAAEQSTLTITVDSRTNSLLVGGTAEYIELVGKVIKDLDASPAEDRQTMIYRPRNSQATDIETALRQFLDQERQRMTSNLGVTNLGAAKELLAHEIAIVAEKTSNTLLISGSPRFFKTVLSMVKELDQPPPQVLINVLLAEVGLDDTTEFGIQWALIGHPESGAQVGAGIDLGLQPIPTVAGSGGSAVSTPFRGFGGLTSDGFSFAISSGDFHLLLRALESQGRVEILSRVPLLASDNQEARINVGQRVPFVTDSRITDSGSVFNTIQYQDVGTIVTVTPRINPDGFVKLQISPEISSLADTTVKISNDVNAVVINTRQAKTTVTVQDGHTVVIGGLITTHNENREDKLPILGDIPLVGLLFKNTKVVKERTELLMILTPRILRNQTDSDVLTNHEVRSVGLVSDPQTGQGIGQVLNPLRGVTNAEVQRIEGGTAEPAREGEPMMIPLRPLPRQATTQP